MPYYRYQYKQQCYVPDEARYTTPVFTQCHPPCAMKCVPCTPCASKGTKLCTATKTAQSSPKCSSPCSSGCAERRTMEGRSSSCSPRCPHPCAVAFPQHHVQGREQLCVPHREQQSPLRCPQMCAPAPMYQHSSYPYSYQWSNSYYYNCGQQ